MLKIEIEVDNMDKVDNFQITLMTKLLRISFDKDHEFEDFDKIDKIDRIGIIDKVGSIDAQDKI